MDKKSQYLFIYPKENLGQNLLIKKSTSDNYIRSKTTRTTHNLISMVNCTQGIKIQQGTTLMQNYMIGKSRTMKHMQEDAGPFKKYRRNQSNNASWCPSSQKYLKINQGISYLETNKCKYHTSPKIQIKRITSYAHRTSIQEHWWTWPTTKPSGNFHRTSCQMVEYPSIKTTDMDNRFDLLYRKIWREKVNQSIPNTYVHPRIGSKKPHKNM